MVTQGIQVRGVASRNARHEGNVLTSLSHSLFLHEYQISPTIEPYYDASLCIVSGYFLSQEFGVLIRFFRKFVTYN